MSLFSKIEWTEATWNPVTGCYKISPGCINCYAERMSLRLKAMGSANYINGFKPTIHEHELNKPLKWKKPRVIFVTSMSDLFQKKVPDDFIFKVFEVMEKSSWHTFQVLTKRGERVLQLNNEFSWPKNVWMGVSIENEDYSFRIDQLRKTKAHIKFLSFEPLLGPLNNLNLENIDWVIVGGESGPKARPMKDAWVKSIRDQCVSANIPFFFKQWGGVNKKKAGRMLEGKIWNELPIVLDTKI